MKNDNTPGYRTQVVKQAVSSTAGQAQASMQGFVDNAKTDFATVKADVAALKIEMAAVAARADNAVKAVLDENAKLHARIDQFETGAKTFWSKVKGLFA